LFGNLGFQAFFQGGQPKANLYLWVVSATTPRRCYRQPPCRKSKELNSKTEDLTGTDEMDPAPQPETAS
jgi:hypothetical protein